MSECNLPESGGMWQCEECGVARPILDDDWDCDCEFMENGFRKPIEAYSWRYITYTVEKESEKKVDSEAPGA